mmetsp:Transcript_15928/g.24610  ORF Transcript_15928/g.24610 Transcript_15928/m.24610 type:complete len:87 (+) Transcript_15928:207-467(+)
MIDDDDQQKHEEYQPNYAQEAEYQPQPVQEEYVPQVEEQPIALTVAEPMPVAQAEVIQHEEPVSVAASATTAETVKPPAAKPEEPH